MLTITLPSPVWLLPLCLHSWTEHSRFLYNIALYSIRLYFHYQSYPQLGVVFTLASSLHSFWSYFSTISSSILGTYQPGEFIFQCHVFLPFHTVHAPVDHILSELSTMTCLSWVALHGMAHGFIELYKGMVPVISLVSFLWLWFSFTGTLTNY